MDDKELIERAARAAGILFDGQIVDGRLFVSHDNGSMWEFWNPITDDGDALRLANILELSIWHTAGIVIARHHEETPAVEHHAIRDRDAATRRAIVSAAAALADNQGGV